MNIFDIVALSASPVVILPLLLAVSRFESRVLKDGQPESLPQSMVAVAGAPDAPSI
jgi:hypothetical protein